MRSLIVTLLVSSCAALMLGGCDNSAVTDHHIRMATEKCDVNGGVKQVEQATSKPLYESCGYRCSRRTGVYEYEAAFSCKNGARFDLTWQE